MSVFGKLALVILIFGISALVSTAIVIAILNVLVGRLGETHAAIVLLAGAVCLVVALED